MCCNLRKTEGTDVSMQKKNSDLLSKHNWRLPHIEFVFALNGVVFSHLQMGFFEFCYLFKFIGTAQSTPPSSLFAAPLTTISKSPRFLLLSLKKGRCSAVCLESIFDFNVWWLPWLDHLSISRNSWNNFSPKTLYFSRYDSPCVCLEQREHISSYNFHNKQQNHLMEMLFVYLGKIAYSSLISL